MNLKLTPIQEHFLNGAKRGNKKEDTKMRKKSYLSILFVIALVIVMMVPAMADTGVKSVSITGSKTVYVGNTIELDSYISPGYLDLKDSQYTWSSSNSSIAKVLVKNDDDTKIKGVKAGTATITVKINGTNLKAAYKITVKKAKKSSVSTAKAKIKAYKKKAKTIKQAIKKIKLASTYSGRRTQYYKYVKKIKKIENKLESLEDTWEIKYERGKISRSQYKSIERKVDSAEDYLERVEDYLEQKFSYEFDD